MQLLKEILNVFEVEVLMKSNPQENKVEIFNQIRGISGVVVVNVIKNDFLENQRTANDEFSLMKIKFIVKDNPVEDLKELRNKIMKGSEEDVVGKINGVSQFLPRIQTLKKVK